MNKLAMVGIGNWGKNHLRTFVSLLGENRVIACDTDTGRLERAQAQYPRLETTTQIGDVLSDSSIDAVVIATPVVTHYDLAKAALSAGKHVLVEKPITLRSSEAEELIALSEHEEKILMVDHFLEYHPAVTALKRLVKEGTLGNLLHLTSQRLNLGVIRSEENALWSLAPHDISVILYLLGEEPIEVAAHGAAYLQPGIEDVCYLTMRFASGAAGHVHLSWLDPIKTRRLTVVGDQAMAVYDDVVQEKLVLYAKRAEKRGEKFVALNDGAHVIQLDPGEPLRKVDMAFLSSIETGQPPLSDGEDGLRVVRVLETAQKSINSGRNPIFPGGST
jgi:predicted dehydrogenase